MLVQVQVIIDAILNRVPQLGNIIKIEQINKGFSNDKKYILYIENNKKILLRLASITDYEKKWSEYNILLDLQPFDVQTSKPIHIGTIEELGYSYVIVSFIEGEDAQEILPGYSEQDQYLIGVAAGEDLAKMHKLIAPKEIISWHTRSMKKHRNYVEAYKTCGIKINNDDKIIAFVEDNEKYLKDRPNVFQHDDFHPGNLIVKERQYAGVIDFNRYDWGDPIHDFYKVAFFSREVSVPFSIGQITGYYRNRDIPDHFWTLYSVYAAMGIFSSIVWSLKVIPEHIDDMLSRIYVILDDHNYFEQLKPSWFQP